MEASRRVRLKDDVRLFTEVLHEDWDGNRFHFNVISAAPGVTVQSALEGIVPPENVFGTEFFTARGLPLHDWDKIRADRLTFP